MYVQIDETVRNQLNKNVICQMLMGSHAHGLNNDNSDIDYLYIFEEDTNSLFREDNGWQYKTRAVDENYQSLGTFIRNVVKSESPTNFEALLGGWNFTNMSNRNGVISDIFTILSKNRSYALIKSYLGFAKKDGAWLMKALQDDRITMDICNKLSHFYRGVETAKILINNEEYIFHAGCKYDSRFRTAYNYKNNHLGSTKISELKEMIILKLFEIDELSKHLNNMLDKHLIHRRFSDVEMKKIDELYKEVKVQSCAIEYGDIVYKIIENGMTFQYN